MSNAKRIILGLPGRGDTSLSRVSNIWMVSVVLVYALLQQYQFVSGCRYTSLCYCIQR